MIKKDYFVLNYGKNWIWMGDEDARKVSAKRNPLIINNLQISQSGLFFSLASA